MISLLLLFAIIINVEAYKSRGSSRGSNRGSSRKTSHNPAPTSYANPQPAAPKPSLFGWQEKPVQRTQTSQARQSKPTNTHSYPSSQTGMSGNSQAKQPTINQESVQKSNPSHSYPGQPAQTNSQPSHSYPASNGLSGSSGSGAGHPQQQGGLSGAGAGYPQQQGGLSGAGAAAAPPAYSGGSYGTNTHNQGPPPPYPGAGYPKQQGTGVSGAAAPPPYSGGSYSNNYGNSYHPQGPPPPYGGYGGHGSYNPMNSPQSPGYFGNYGNKGYGGVGRSSNVLTGVGIAGAGVGTILTGLALWNLARSTGQHRNTVIYDNRGQPVAVAPANGTQPAVDPILGDLVNCSLTISTDNATEVLAIPCSIATSFTPDADVKDTSVNTTPNDSTKCTVSVVNKMGREFTTTIPCSTLLNTAAENNVTEPPLLVNDQNKDMVNGTITSPGDAASDLSTLRLTSIAPENINLNCTVEPGEIRDPINPCYAVNTHLTVIPLELNNNTTPSSA